MQICGGVFHGRAAPTSAAYAGGGARRVFALPTRLVSSEDSIRPLAQLRLTFARRRRTNTEDLTSCEKGAHRRKAPAPMRVGFAGAAARAELSPPMSLRSAEDSLRFRAQLRPTFARRRRTNTEDLTSCEKGAHGRKAPAPIRIVFAGAGASAKSSPPTSLRSAEDSLRFRA